MNFNPRSHMLGVEIQEGAIYAALLQGDRRGWTMAGFRSQPLSPTLLEEEPPAQRIASALQQAIRQLPGRRPRQAAFALPDALVACRRCTLPIDLEKDVLETALFAEAEGLLPYPIEDLAMDYRFLPDTKTRDGKVTAEIAVCRHRNLEQLQSIAQAIGLRAVCAEPAAAARTRGQQMLGISQNSGDTPALQLETALTPAERHSFSLACGLAAGGGFNLFPWRERRQRATNRNFIAAAVLVVLLAQALVLAEYRQLRVRADDWQAQNAALSQQVAALQQETAHLKRKKQEITQLAQDIRIVHGWRQQQHAVLEMLLSLGRALPPGLRLRQVRLQGGELELEGNAFSMEEVNLLLASTEHSKPWRNAHISGIQTVKDSEQQLRFKIRGRLAPPEGTD